LTSGEPLAESRPRDLAGLACGGILKWPTRADCKSAGLRLRRFESFSHHHLFQPVSPNPAPYGTGTAYIELVRSWSSTHHTLIGPTLCQYFRNRALPSAIA